MSSIVKLPLFPEPPVVVVSKDDAEDELRVRDVYIPVELEERYRDLVKRRQQLLGDAKLIGTDPLPILRFRGVYYPTPPVDLTNLSKCADQTAATIAHDDVTVASYPKAGTTWMLAIVHEIITHGKGLLPVANVEDVYTWYAATDKVQDLMKVEKCCHVAHPQIIKEHSLFGQVMHKQNVGRYVYMCRDPADSWVSYIKMKSALFGKKDGPTQAGYFAAWMSDCAPYGGWGRNVASWYQASRRYDNILFIFFEDLREKPHAWIRKVSEFLGVQLTETELEAVVAHTSLSAMRGEQYQPRGLQGMRLDCEKTSVFENFDFVGRGAVGENRQTVDPAMRELLYDWAYLELCRYGGMDPILKRYFGKQQ
mmetsp:Transcript_30342/g.84818  ORF Transcript_30342/g.84818 Transcript_30342/m.84818 type:complete len:366 (-) Transcript_30342:200-1297(-)